jgi:hypothetical protein
MGNFVVLEQEEIGERGLRSFDLGGKQGFLPDIHEQKQRRGRQNGCDAVQLAECTSGGIVGGEQRG